MCGIAGEVSFRRPPNAEAVSRMTEQLVHRGPDAHGFFNEGPAALGHRRLSILDLEGGAQPMTRAGVTLVFNGQVYNHPALRETLRGLGHPFSTRSDTEVVLQAYLQWGEPFVEHLQGMFAIALWDGRTRKLVLARDRMGKKPVYYALGNRGRWLSQPPAQETLSADALVFGSELKAFAAHGDFARELEPRAVAKYLAVEYVPAPWSIFRGIFKLPAAHVATFDEKGFRAHRYWALPEPEAEGSVSADDAAPELLRLLDAAVSERLVADVPVGVFLSGGIDSTALAALAVQHHRPLETFSIGFAEASFDESGFSRLAAEALKTHHHVETLSGEACTNLLPEVVSHLDEPFADPSILPTVLLSRFTRQHVKVALAGDGGDELFAGYDTFLAHRPAAWLARMPQSFIRSLSFLAEHLPASSRNMSLDFRLKQLLRGLNVSPALRHQTWIGSFGPAELRKLLTSEFLPHVQENDLYAEVLAELTTQDAGSVDEALHFFQTRYLTDDILVKADRASMMASLEVRAPFLDTRVVEFAARLPWQTKLSLSRTKIVLKKAVASIVPQEILSRPKKGFGIPVARWIRGPLRAVFEDLFSTQSLSRSGLFEPRAARGLLERHIRGQADLRKPLWTMAMLLLWQRAWVFR